jgi:hypothetical protein
MPLEFLNIVMKFGMYIIPLDVISTAPVSNTSKAASQFVERNPQDCSCTNLQETRCVFHGVSGHLNGITHSLMVLSSS